MDAHRPLSFACAARRPLPAPPAGPLLGCPPGRTRAARGTALAVLPGPT